MQRFDYQAVDRRGATTSGQLEATELSAAIDQLASRGLQVLEIRVVPEETAATQATTTERTTTRKLDIESVYKTPALQAALTDAIAQRERLVPALEAVADELPPGSTRRDVLELADALQTATEPQALLVSKRTSHWLPLLSAGLADQPNRHHLAELIATAARESQRRSDRLRLLAYPIVLGVVAFVVFGLLCALVVPSFESMFEDFGMEVPGLTQWVIGISYQFRQHLPRTIIAMVVVGISIYLMMRLWSRFSAGYRLFGPLAAGGSSGVAAMAALCGSLAELISMGVPIPEAIFLAGEGCRHDHFRQVAKQLARDAQRHQVPLTSSPVADEVPANLLYALDPPESDQPNISLLRELAVIYRKRGTHRIDWIAEASSYLAVLIVGFAVGLVIVALFMPLINLVSALS